MALNRARVANDIGVTTDLNYVIAIEFFDSAVPGTVLWAEQFLLPLGATTTQLSAAVVQRGQNIRAALAARDAARVSVPQGTIVTVT